MPLYEWLFAPPGSRPAVWDERRGRGRPSRARSSPHDACVLVAEDGDGALIGFCTGIPGPALGPLRLPGLGRGPRGRPRAAAREGVGKALLDAAKAWARERGATHLELDSAEARTDAHRFYEREGAELPIALLRLGALSQRSRAPTRATTFGRRSGSARRSRAAARSVSFATTQAGTPASSRAAPFAILPRIPIRFASAPLATRVSVSPAVDVAAQPRLAAAGDQPLARVRDPHLQRPHNEVRRCHPGADVHRLGVGGAVVVGHDQADGERARPRVGALGRGGRRVVVLTVPVEVPGVVDRVAEVGVAGARAVEADAERQLAAGRARAPRGRSGAWLTPIRWTRPPSRSV